MDDMLWALFVLGFGYTCYALGYAIGQRRARLERMEEEG
jgi:hypothetical protein